SGRSRRSQMRDPAIDDRPKNLGVHAVAAAAEPTSRARLARREHGLRIWDLLQLGTPWLLLALSTTLYFAWVLPASGEDYWPDGASVLGLVAVTATWVLFGHTLPIWRRTLRPLPTVICVAGFLALCLILMSHSEVFVILT